MKAGCDLCSGNLKEACCERGTKGAGGCSRRQREGVETENRPPHPMPARKDIRDKRKLVGPESIQMCSTRRPSLDFTPSVRDAHTPQF